MKAMTRIRAAVAALALCLMVMSAGAQDMNELLDKLTGKTPVPMGQGQQGDWTADYEKAIDHLLPLMAVDDVGARYAPQITFQQICLHASRPRAEQERQALEDVLLKTLAEKDLIPTVQRWFVLQLQRMGGEKSVPALTQMMGSSDKELRDLARRALEKNPSDESTTALVENLKHADDPVWTIGLLESLGEKQSNDAIFEIAKRLKSDNPKVMATAIAALARIQTKEAFAALAPLVNQEPDESIHIRLGQELVAMAYELTKKNEHMAAAYIYRTIHEYAGKHSLEPTDVPVFLRAAAINGLAICEPALVAELVTEAIQDADPKIRAAAVQAAHVCPSKAAMRALADMLSELEPANQIQVLGLIEERGDLSYEWDALRLMWTRDENVEEAVQRAALAAAAAVGGEMTVRMLLFTASNEESPLRNDARQALAVMAGPQVEEALLAGANDDFPWRGDRDMTAARVVAIEALASRQAAGVTRDQLLTWAGDDSETIAASAIEALADVVTAGDLDAIVALMAKGRPNTVAQLGAALKACLMQAEDKHAAAGAVYDLYQTGATAVKCQVLTALGAMGGERALTGVAETAKTADNEEVVDAAVRALADWPGFEAAEACVAVASRDTTSLKHKVVALRGALRMIEEAQDVAIDERANLCVAAFRVAPRVEEKKLALQTMGGIPHMKTSALVQELLTNDELKEAAAEAGIAMAKRAPGDQREHVNALLQAIVNANLSDALTKDAKEQIK